MPNVFVKNVVKRLILSHCARCRDKPCQLNYVCEKLEKALEKIDSINKTR